MARRYKRYYRRMYPKKRWASNIVTDNSLVTLGNGETTSQSFSNICTNSLQTNTPTPVIVKFGRCKVKGDIRTDAAANNNYVSGIMYMVFCPQGNTPNINLINDHPEYIMGWTQISLDSGNTFSFSSALKRNLNSGDSVSLLFYVNSVNSVQAVRNFNFYYTVQFWTTSA